MHSAGPKVLESKCPVNLITAELLRELRYLSLSCSRVCRGCQQLSRQEDQRPSFYLPPSNITAETRPSVSSADFQKQGERDSH